MANKRKRMEVLRLEVPFSSESPQLTSEAVGLPRVMHRPAASLEMDATILDCADGRLLRDGVIVAHRIIGGLGEWYLAAPRWSPTLPDERIQPLGHSGDLPDEFASYIRPFVRHGVLGTIAGLHSERDEWALRDDDGEVAAYVKDEKVTIRRSGITTARYREITVTPTRALTGQQREFLLSAALAVNAIVVDSFPTLQQRLGAPATGLTNYPLPQALRRDFTLEEFATEVFAGHLQSILLADLARRAEDRDDLADLNAALWAFGRDLRGLAPVLEPAWRESLEQRLSGLPYESAADLEPAVLDVLDALVGSVLAPRLGDLSQRQAAEVLFERAEQATYILADRCRALEVTSPDDKWQAALRAAEQLDVAAGVAAPLFPKAMGRLLNQLEDLLDDLRGSAVGSLAGDPELDGLSAEQAYQLGLDAERRRSSVRERRAQFIRRWPDRVVAARKVLAKAEKKRK